MRFSAEHSEHSAEGILFSSLGNKERVCMLNASRAWVHDCLKHSSVTLNLNSYERNSANFGLRKDAFSNRKSTVWSRIIITISLSFSHLVITKITRLRKGSPLIFVKLDKNRVYWPTASCVDLLCWESYFYGFGEFVLPKLCGKPSHCIQI